MNFENKVKRAIFDAFEKELQEKGIKYFVGGSQRFGWENTNSDLDIFVLFPESKLSYYLHRLLELSHSELPPQLDPYTNNNRQFSFLGGLIHLTIFDSDIHGKDAEFDMLEKEHQKIEDLIQADPKVLYLAFYLKSLPLKGAIVYRSLRTLI